MCTVNSVSSGMPISEMKTPAEAETAVTVAFKHGDMKTSSKRRMADNRNIDLPGSR